MEKMNREELYWEYPATFWTILVSAIALGGWVYWGAITDMVHRWNNQEEYGYGYLIPIISAFLVWQRKNELARIPFNVNLIGFLVIFLAGILLIMGLVATTYTLAQYSLVLAVLGTAYTLLGWPAFRIVAVPLALLFFMVPLPPFVFNTLSGELQLISSEIGVAVIRLFDISVYLEGNVIDLGTYKLQVVEACSGLRYLFPLMSLSFVAAYIYKGEVWKKTIIFLSSMPITVLMNSFRIGVIGVLVEYGGPEQAEGFLHDFEGWIIFMACMAILVGEMYLLGKFGKTRGSLAELFGIDFPEPLPEGVEMKLRTVPPFSWGLPVLFLGILVAVIVIGDRENVVPDGRKMFSEFPRELGGWSGRFDRLESIYLDSLKLDDYILSDYTNDAGKSVNQYVAYYGDQIAGEAAHSPRACIPGGGWQVKAHRVIEIGEVIIYGQPLIVNRLMIAKGDYKQVVYYWFQQRGRIIANEYMVKWYLFWDSLTRQRSDGALVRFTALIGPGESEQEADQRLVEFAEIFVPELEAYIPN